MTSASKAQDSIPDILSSAASSQDVDARGGLSNTLRAMIVSHVTDDLMREEIDTSSVEAADPEQTHAQSDMPSASQTMALVPDDISSAPAFCDVGTRGE